MFSRLNTIGFKLFGTSALIILLAAFSVAALGYRQARRAILAEAQRHVLGVVRERSARLEIWLRERGNGVQAAADAGEILQALGGAKSGSPQGRARLREAAERLVGRLRREQDIRFAALLDASGDTLAAFGEGGERGFPADVPAVRSALAGRVSWGSIHLDLHGRAVINLAVPLHDSRGGTAGVFFVQYPTAAGIDPILADTTGLGMRGEAFLVGRDTTMLTPSRFHEHPRPLTHKMPIPPVLAALEGGSGVMIYRGFLGREVLGAYTFQPEQGWAVITEMDLEEAFSPLRTIMMNTLLAAGIALLVMLAVALALARSWTRPLERLAAASEGVASGDYSIRVPEGRRGDEIGVLLRSFNRMVHGLEQAREELNRSHERLLQAEKLAAVGELVASIVHEMRNPLSSVKMNLRLLDRKIDSGSPEAEFVSLASGEVKRLETMLSGLLDYSKPLRPASEPVEVEELARLAVQGAEEEARARGVDLRFEVAGTIRRLEGDRELLLRALANLLANAVEASAEGSEVVLAVRDDGGDRLVLEVRDTGRGMSRKVLERLFDPFFTTREEGIGLGMGNVKKIVEAHEGKIEVSSREGEGTTVRLYLQARRGDGEASGG